jgi:alcohol dehydrogenase
MSLPATMSGVVLTRHGGPEALVWRSDLPVPVPGRGQALVRVLAAGVNNTDIATREGWYAREATGQGGAAGGWAGAIAFPRIQGGDLCGRVVALGEGVLAPAVGRRVTAPINLARPTADNPVGFIALGSEIDGAFAQFCLMEAADLHDVTVSPLSDVEIAAMPCAFGTAENLLTRAGVAAGERVLVTGASGGVGLAAVQLAVQRGAEVTGSAGAEKAWAVRDAGARAVIGRDETPEPRAFDAVIDVVGGPAFPALLRALRPGGRYAVAGAIAGALVEADLRDIYLSDLTLHGCTFQPPEVFAALVARINAGTVRPLVSRTYPLSDIALAQEDFVTKRYPGKLVLIPEAA